ncbi:transposase [Nonomuraea dietziae]|uniref:transposase n=1 Tax=Nonomuraea dietziae TaxID=65515 RepID=UPI003404897A
MPGWAWQHVTQLNLDHDSWVAPMDVVRVPTGGPAQTLAAVEQIRAMAGRLRAAGRTGRKLFVLDAGYDLAVLAYELHGERDVTGEHAARCADLPQGTHHQLCGVHTTGGDDDLEVLVRIRNDRLLYRDPPPREPGNGGRPGRPRRHGEAFSCAQPDTWGEPGQQLTLTDEHYGRVTVSAWHGLPPKLDKKGPLRPPGRSVDPVRDRHLCPGGTATRRPQAAPRSQCGCSGPAEEPRTWTDAGDRIFAGSTSIAC